MSVESQIENETCKCLKRTTRVGLIMFLNDMLSVMAALNAHGYQSRNDEDVAPPPDVTKSEVNQWKVFHPVFSF